MPNVTIYTKDYCPFCSLAKDVLTERDVEFLEIDVTRSPTLQREMIEKSKRQTVPQIFVGQDHVGGSDDLLEFSADGRLDELLKGGNIAV